MVLATLTVSVATLLGLSWCSWLGLARTMYIRCIYGILAEKSPNIRSYTVYINGSGQPYSWHLSAGMWINTPFLIWPTGLNDAVPPSAGHSACLGGWGRVVHLCVCVCACVCVCMCVCVCVCVLSTSAKMDNFPDRCMNRDTLLALRNEMKWDWSWRLHARHLRITRVASTVYGKCTPCMTDRM